MQHATGKKIILLGLGVLAVALFFLLDLDAWLTLDSLKSSQQLFRDLYGAHPVLVPGFYFCVYFSIIALNLPGAAVLTLAGGALFGFWEGMLLASFASTLGATMACFMTRYLFREPVQKRFGPALKKINEGIVREGAFYLFTLRLIPVFPFFVINLLMGLTRLPLLTFYWVSQLGMLPGTMVYINAGRELGRIDSLRSVLSPSLLISFVLLGLFPFTVKKIMDAVQKRRGAG